MAASFRARSTQRCSSVSIVGCAILVSAIERGALDTFLATWLGKFVTEPPSGPPGEDDRPCSSSGRSDFQESPRGSTSPTPSRRWMSRRGPRMTRALQDGGTPRSAYSE
jgi:hypothetical protein